MIQSYNDATDTAIAVITRAAASGPSYLFRPKGLQAQQRYTVWFEIDPSVYSQTGAQLMSNGVRVMLPQPYSSEVVHIEAATADRPALSEATARHVRRDPRCPHVV